MTQKPGRKPKSQPPSVPEINRDKLRARLRKLGDEFMFYLLDEAIELLPPARAGRAQGRGPLRAFRS